jgi:uncharacterized protein
MTPRTFCLLLTAVASSMIANAPWAAARAVDARPKVNLALVAKASTSFVSGHETLAAVHDGFAPAHSDDKSHGAYGNWPRTGTQWVQYQWSQPISTNKIEVYWFDDQRGVRLPKSCRLKYWNGTSFVALPGATGLGLAKNEFNATTFPEITTSKLRLEFDGDGTFSTGILEWRVYDSGASPNFAPTVRAGADRVVVLNGQAYLSGTVTDDGKPKAATAVRWSKQSGPGEVTFIDPDLAATAAQFSAVGTYTLRLTADDGELRSLDTLTVTVDPPPPSLHLEPVPTTAYRITSPFWKARTKGLIVNWIPHCVRKIEDPHLPEGGIENFVQAARKLAGHSDAKHIGPVFANGWVYNTLESMCLALLVDPQGDPEILAAQAAMRKTVDDWIPKILAAQEPDGYLHTMYTIQGRKRWSNKFDHEGYQAGYFIEAAIAHSILTDGKDPRMYDAAKRLADLWCAKIGPAPKMAWYDGHQALELALVRLARFVEQKEGPGRGRKYVDLAKFLLDSRKGGEEYDQSHLPVTRQYEAVGHAVRAAYSYSAAADIAMESGDIDYHSAVKSIWSNLVNRKYYVTGGLGSGETSEGFGKDYSLPNQAYCESCADCGELFFQHRMGLAYQDARYADLAEETLYNAILGSIDLEAKNFTYTNALDSDERRYPWHPCPCCVGNIPRVLLSLPTWMYAKAPDGLFVNLFIGSEVAVDDVAGTRVQLVQTTDYPWSGKVSILVNPAEAKRFSVRIRVPNRNVSQLYTASPDCKGIASLRVNGAPETPTIDKGYLVLRRTWQRGDKIDLVIPLMPQRVKASNRVVAARGRVALRYGPLVYNIESVDQDVNSVLGPASALSTEWRNDLLGGVMVITGAYANGTAMMAVPNYTRLNRGGRSIVWIKDKP